MLIKNYDRNSPLVKDYRKKKDKKAGDTFLLQSICKAMKPFLVCLIALALLTASHGMTITLTCTKRPGERPQCVRTVDPNGKVAKAVVGGARPPPPQEPVYYEPYARNQDPNWA
ncbi:hypothetical protein CDAR_593151 [Caerostris darwini]|uniref:Uncharacterized protein n=1 Tax=Caerostris darwini TaxID=1538125 RepID=A0AAV4TZ11_9ARAC|nr:hypothetical protein CDAR_593151 [Caerostris darwini]